MFRKNIGILGVGSYLPKDVLTNFDLEKIVDTTDEWIRTRTGIEERRIAPEEMTVSYMAAEAAKEAIKNANVAGEDIDMILVATVTPTYSFPSVACMIQEELGIKGIPCMDISAACTGFVYAMVNASHLLESGLYRRILVVGADKLASRVDWNDRNTCVLFGDGAGAVVLGEVSEGRGILSYDLGADGTGGQHLYDDDKIFMNGREVFKFATRQLPASCVRTLEKAKLSTADIDFLVPHQANIRIIEYAVERLNLPIEKASTTVRHHGNTSAASIPLALYEELSKGNITDGDNVLFVGFGGGLTWGSMCVKWGR